MKKYKELQAYCKHERIVEKQIINSWSNRCKIIYKCVRCNLKASHSTAAIQDGIEASNDFILLETKFNEQKGIV